MTDHLFFYGVIITSSILLYLAIKLIDRFSNKTEQ